MKVLLLYLIIVIAIVGIIAIVNKVFNQRWYWWIGYGITGLIIIAFMWNVSDPNPAFGDFTKAYYPSGKWVLEDPEKLYKGKGFNGFVNIPILAYLFTPLAYLNKPTAQISMLVLGIIVLIGTYFYLIKKTQPTNWQKMALLGSFIINGPLFYSLKQGNNTHFMLLPLFAAVFLLKEKREFLAGFLLAFVALIKLPLLLFGGYLLLRKKWQALTGFVSTILLTLGASLLIFGINLHMIWYQESILPYIGKPISRYNVQSLDSFLVRLVASYDVLGTGRPIEVDFGFKLVRYLLLALLVGGAIWICWRCKQPTTPETANIEFSIVLCMAIIISPISWTHYYLLLLLPLSLYICQQLAISQNRLWFTLMLIVTLLISLPVKGLGGSGNPFFQLLVSRLLISHYFLGGIFLLGILLAARFYFPKPPQISGDNINALA